MSTEVRNISWKPTLELWRIELVSHDFVTVRTVQIITILSWYYGQKRIYIIIYIMHPPPKYNHCWTRVIVLLKMSSFLGLNLLVIFLTCDLSSYNSAIWYNKLDLVIIFGLIILQITTQSLKFFPYHNNVLHVTCR